MLGKAYLGVRIGLTNRPNVAQTDPSHVSIVTVEDSVVDFAFGGANGVVIHSDDSSDRHPDFGVAEANAGHRPNGRRPVVEEAPGGGVHFDGDNYGNRHPDFGVAGANAGHRPNGRRSVVEEAPGGSVHFDGDNYGNRYPDLGVAGANAGRRPNGRRPVDKETLGGVHFDGDGYGDRRPLCRSDTVPGDQNVWAANGFPLSGVAAI
ncbi:hypothetical protein [Haloarcula marismortui]|uniref:Uncharacterized protein n=1 Tax=Haloarcula marismortui ATCC 33800 TaxID=662476 RepID=M0JII0_9EURY|nr:hypothetical protein [Haloarcula sinaiiensis]EMA08163.1 hypothetical protein C436_20558 [Haloarcula sinaiiensis ATCC 33800]QUJ74006.1 hypothetical protein KDQ40_18735 [Haloarcula sinaiiensis ATCC 33800]